MRVYSLLLMFVVFCSSSLPGHHSKERFKREFVVLDGWRMAYHAEGKGDPIVFLHGNPTSSYIWRKIIPHVKELGNCLAPDLMGMGMSEKVPATITNRYTYGYHYRMVDLFLRNQIDPNRKIILVAHDWGGVLAIHWARNHPERVLGIVFMETFLEPLETGRSPQFAIDWFKNWRTVEMEKAVLDSNRFVEQVLLGEVGRYLTEEDISEYRSPFVNKGEGRLTTLLWPRQVPIDKDPAETHQILVDNMAFMAKTQIRKLFINSEPGAILAPEPRRNIIRQWPNLDEVKVQGRHFVQESSPDSIGNHLKKWIIKCREQSPE